MTAEKQRPPEDPAWAYRRRITDRGVFAVQVSAPVYLRCDTCEAPFPGRRPKHRHGFGLTAEGLLLILDHEERKNLTNRDPDGNTIVGTSGFVVDGGVAAFHCGWHAQSLTLAPGDLLAIARNAVPPGVTCTFSQVRRWVSR